MIVRKLKTADAPFMLEWMHDSKVVEHLSANFAAKTLADCENFIAFAQNSREDLHLAVADEADEYMGTVSLKHLDPAHKTAEFAITFRSRAQGKGYARFGMHRILEIGLQELGLETIYWCVSPVNGRAVHFYDKNGCRRVKDVPEHILAAYDPALPLQWYAFKKEDLACFKS